MTNDPWFALDQNAERNNQPNLGAPVELVAGKWGNPKLLKWPKIVPPGHELYLKMVHYGNLTPDVLCPVYVTLIAQLVSSPAAVEDRAYRGTPIIIPQRFDFTDTHLDLYQSKVIESQINAKGDLLLDSLCTRHENDSIVDGSEWKNSWDPRQWEQEIMLKLRGSSMQNGFLRGDPIPLSLVSGRFGARKSILPSYFKLKKGDSLIAEVMNQTETDIEEEILLTHFGLLCGAES